MPDRADAHIHLFARGFQGESFAGRPGVTLDEAACYASLAQEHNIRHALVVGYEADPWAKGNNAYLAGLARQHDWVRPVAYVNPATPPTVEQLNAWRTQRFVGVSFYVFDEAVVEALHAMPEAVWHWLEGHRWLISVNAREEHWRAWRPVLERHPKLRLMIAHLGLPPAVSSPPTPTQAEAALASVLDLAAFDHVHIKLSGFYALTDPGYDYPHEAAWPFVQTVVDRFGVARCLWGSDFSPHLGQVSFPQTLGVLTRVPFLNHDDRIRLEGANLLARLAEVEP